MTTRLLIIVLAAGFGAADARAIVRVFFTSSAQPYGLTNPALAFQPTEGSQTDPAFYQVAAFPPLEAWDQTPTINWENGDFAYIWLRFHQETNNRKIQGVQFDFDDVPAEIAYYIMDDLNGDTGAKRWAGAYSMPGAPEFKLDPQFLSAEQAVGIVNRPTAFDNWNLYDNASRTALLGTVRYDGNGLRGLQALTWPPIPIPPGPYIVWETGQANWVPEPATLGAALALCAAAGRRDRHAAARRRRELA